MMYSAIGSRFKILVGWANQSIILATNDVENFAHLPKVFFLFRSNHC